MKDAILLLAALTLATCALAAVPSVPLHNGAVPGLRMPILGLGTGGFGHYGGIGGDVWDDSVSQKAVRTFLMYGGRRIDSSLDYKTQKGVGAGMRFSGTPRSQVFLVSKIDTEEYGLVPPGYNETIQSIQQSLDEFQTSYIDLMLIHWPGPGVICASMKKKPPCFRKPDDWSECRRQTWLALEDMFRARALLAIGVSNFDIKHLEEIKNLGGYMPAVNQIEYHPYWHKDDVVDWCKRHNIVVNGYSPLGCMDHVTWLIGKRPSVLLVEHDVVKQVAKEVKKTPAQVLQRWEIHKGLVINPRAREEKHIVENLSVLDFELSTDQISRLDHIDTPPANVCGDMSEIP
jgi:diketogulonate reductase-like aldo/keto reductase